MTSQVLRRGPLRREDEPRGIDAPRRGLAPGGRFILVDIARQEGETRQQYLDTYLHTMRTQWTAVRAEDMDAACAHVAAYDFPETVADLTRMSTQAGFVESRLVDRFAQHHVMVFQKA